MSWRDWLCTQEGYEPATVSLSILTQHIMWQTCFGTLNPAAYRLDQYGFYGARGFMFDLPVRVAILRQHKPTRTPFEEGSFGGDGLKKVRAQTVRPVSTKIGEKCNKIIYAA